MIHWCQHAYGCHGIWIKLWSSPLHAILLMNFRETGGDNWCLSQICCPHQFRRGSCRSGLYVLYSSQRSPALHISEHVDSRYFSTFKMKLSAQTDWGNHVVRDVVWNEITQRRRLVLIEKIKTNETSFLASGCWVVFHKLSFSVYLTKKKKKNNMIMWYTENRWSFKGVSHPNQLTCSFQIKQIWCLFLETRWFIFYK